MQSSVDRRTFLAGSISTAVAAGAVNAAESKAEREHYELRVFSVASASQKKIVNGYLQRALVPALNRVGVKRVGVFTNLDDAKDRSLFMLIPYSSLDMLSGLNDRLAADHSYRAAAKEYFDQPVESPAYLRISSRLMRAFDSIPVIEQPLKPGQPRIFELRTYESHNEDAAARKIEMFDKGETQLMRDVKLGPVFFGETLISNDVPNLTYMLVAPDLKVHKAHWEAFLESPEWERMKKIPRYQNTVSKIRTWYLAPTDYSQV